MINYAFTGDVKKLKTIGYEFQKLYNNYKSYHKDKIFMFVIDKMKLEISNVNPNHQVALIDFILENKNKPKDFWMTEINIPMGKFTKSPIWVDNFCLTQFGNVVDRIQWKKLLNETFDLRDSFSDVAADHDTIRKELDKLEAGHDPIYIRSDLIKAIIELDNLHPLEIIKIKNC